MESVGGLIKFEGTSLGASRCGLGGLMLVVDFQMSMTNQYGLKLTGEVKHLLS